MVGDSVTLALSQKSHEDAGKDIGDGRRPALVEPHTSSDIRCTEAALSPAPPSNSFAFKHKQFTNRPFVNAM